jgi:hypothetical protein
MAGGDDHADSGGRIPFWIHQVVELLLGVLLLVEGARTGEHTVVLATLGALLLVLVLCSDGALGAWPWIGRRLHRVLDFVVAGALAVSPILLGVDQVLAVVILESAAAGMVWLALRTEWRTRRKRRAERPAPPAPSPAETRAAAPHAPRAPAPPTAPAEPLARKLGSAVGKARDDGPRQLGRLVGRAQRAAKAAMAPETPAEPPERPEGPVEDGGGNPGS